MKQGDIWLINLDPTIGAEIRKTRPAIVVNDNALGRLSLKIIVPVTEWNEKYKIAPWMIKISADKVSGLSKDSCADCFQIRSVSQKRFVRKLGTITNVNLNEIKSGMARVLSIDSE